MRYSIATAALVATVAAQAPAQKAGPGCLATVPGTFEIEVVNVTNKRDALEERADGGALVLNLNNGVLKDAKGRIGYIAANSQFQFDYSVDGGLPQTGSIYTSGWAVCGNQTLVLGPQAVFKQCLSGSFYNLYAVNDAPQCSPVYIQAINSNGGSESEQPDGQPTGKPVSQMSDGQPQAVTQISDGQIQAPTGMPVTQISDGQIQAPTGVPVSQISDGQIQASTGKPVSQISDGQIQAPTGKPVSQISDGQIQAPTGMPVSQISDGQIQAPTGMPVSQISDGQIQAPTGMPVSQISDGQIQAPTGKPVSQISDGQIQAATATGAYTGAASLPTVRSEFFGLAAGVLAVAML